MKKLFVVLFLALPLFGAESFLQLPTDAANTGKMLRMRTSTQGANTVYTQGMFLDDGAGSGPLGISSNPIFVNFAAGATAAVTQSGTWTVTGAGGTFPVTGTFWQATQPVSGTFWQATQPVSIAATVTTSEANRATADYDTGAGTVTTAMIGMALPASGGPVAGGTATAPVRIDPTGGTTQPVSGTFWQATQPVSGTVAATESGTWTVQPGNTANTTAWKVDGSAVTQPVSGTFWQATQPVSGTVAATESGTWTVQPGNTANTTAWKVDGSAVTQPVSGTVTTTPPANQSVNFNQTAGNATLTGNGVTGAGSQRVTIASDNTAFTVNAAQSGTWTNTVTQPTAANLNATVVQGTAAASTAGWPGTLGQTATTSAAWTSATTIDTTLALAVSGYGTVMMTNDVTGTVATANLIFEASTDGGTLWRTWLGSRADSFTSPIVSTLSASTSSAYTFPTTGITNFRVRLNPAITNTGTATIRLIASAGATNPYTNTNISHIAGSVVNTTGGLNGTFAVGGVNANNSTINQNPMLIGIEAISTQPTAATSGNLRRQIGSLDGAQYTRAGGPVTWNCGLTAIGTTLTECQAAPGAGLKLYVTDINVGSNTATGGQFLLRYGTGTNCATSPVTLFPAIAAQTTGVMPYPGNTASLANINFTTPPAAAAANAICVVCVVTNTCVIAMEGFTAP